MGLTLTKVLSPIASVTGGDIFYVLGTFAPGVPYQVLVGGNPAASGICGQPYVLYTIDGTSLTCYAPPVPAGSPVDVLVQDNLGNSATLPGALSSQPAFYSAQTFAFRSILPPLYNTGPRSFADLPQVGA